MVVLDAVNAVAALDVALFFAAASFSLGVLNNAAQLDGGGFEADPLFTGDDAAVGAGDGVAIPFVLGDGPVAVDACPLGVGVGTVVTGADAVGV